MSDVQTDSATDTTTADDVQLDAENVDTTTADEQPGVDTGDNDDADSFPREYVEKLRKENAGYRQKAKDAEAKADAHARDLFAARVAATGLLADARDMPFDPEWLDDETELRGAIAALLDERPHLKARTIAGDVGQGRRDSAEPVNLVELLRGRV